MSKESKIDESWVCWFQKVKETNPFSLAIFLIILNDFVEQRPHDAEYLTIETLHIILLKEINANN